MEPLELRGRTAVITGAASGIGRALAHDAVTRGMSVAIADVDEAGLMATAEALRERQGRVLPMVVDVRSAEAVERFAEACFAEFASIAVVFSNAGVLRRSSAAAFNLADWNYVLDVNLGGMAHCAAAFVPRMVARAEPAQFVMTGSQASFMAVPNMAGYVASKHAIWGLADVLRVDLEAAQSPVGVSMLAPPRVATAIVSQSVDMVRESQGDEAADTFWRDMVQPEFVAALTLDKAAAREFFILPSDDFKPGFKARVAPLI